MQLYIIYCIITITRYSRPEHACTCKYIRKYLDLYLTWLETEVMKWACPGQVWWARYTRWLTTDSTWHSQAHYSTTHLYETKLVALPAHHNIYMQSYTCSLHSLLLTIDWIQWHSLYITNYLADIVGIISYWTSYLIGERSRFTGLGQYIGKYVILLLPH